MVVFSWCREIWYSFNQLKPLLYLINKVVPPLDWIKIIGIKTSRHDLNIVGYRRATIAYTKGCKNVNFS